MDLKLVLFAGEWIESGDAGRRRGRKMPSGADGGRDAIRGCHTGSGGGRIYEGGRDG